ncbi:hypothetical protein [Nocardia sp. NRRL S-836]|uniref:hypothetical protein n=1 Tax=Nocardia sp. NRRL S-836 TaxID=1519492 RepID=UPI0006AF289A|nr:hypothetical protein [Nocardia sp. NRRL S-836]KOV85303.1 hypothetical protein ADL03_14170 [Nocardia sp. NRRL S-836]
MATKPCPGRGAVITYLNPDVMHPSVYVRAVVIGVHVVDPLTSHTWVPVLRPDGAVLVLDTANIIKVQPEPGRA